LPAEDRTFGDVNRTISTPQGVYFQTPTHFMLWANDRIRIWKPTQGFLGSDIVDDQLFAVLKGVGLTRFDGETFVPLPGGQEVADKATMGMTRLAGAAAPLRSEARRWR
jgi:hypothetical protein